MTTEQPQSPLQALAMELESEQADQATASNPQSEQDAAQQAQFAKQLDAGMEKFTLGAFKVLRSVLSKRLPELREEWGDDVIQPPAEAMVPLLKRYMASLMAKLGENPELAVFAMSIIPLVMGYMDALDRHEANVTDVTPKHDEPEQ